MDGRDHEKRPVMTSRLPIGVWAGKADHPLGAQGRLLFLQLIVIAMAVLLFLRAFQLQIVQGGIFVQASQRNRTHILFLRAPRGNIFDRNGEVLADSVPNFAVFLSPLPLKTEGEGGLVKILSEGLQMSPIVVSQRIREARSTKRMVPLAEDVSRRVALGLLERRPSLPGVSVLVQPKRRYRYKTHTAHFLGYLSEITSRELYTGKDGGYRLGNLVGRTGLERQYEPFLRGQSGGMAFEVDAVGRQVRVLESIESRTGYDIYSTLDVRIQQAASEGLENSVTGRGAAVAVDPRTGEILAFASSPGFDPNSTIASHLTRASQEASSPFFIRAFQGPELIAES